MITFRPRRVFAAVLLLAMFPVARAIADDAAFAGFDRRIERLMNDHQIPGLSLAVTDQGRLVYVKAYGMADREAKTPVTTDSLFRIASISKPITAVAVLTLADQDKLSLDDHVLGILPLGEEIATITAFDTRWNDVTVGHLLAHRGGWDRDASFDPMFRSVRFAEELSVDSPAGPKHVIQAMLRRRLDFDPGEKYAYSNFGYCLLGRLIEQVTGEPYERYVRRQVLEPMGIRSMRIGRTRQVNRFPLEVTYYDPAQRRSVFADDRGKQVPAPYGAWYLEAMDAHGGWIGTATDLARFAAAFDDPAKCPVLSPDMVETMNQPVEAELDRLEMPGSFYYSLGWSNRVTAKGKVNHWHSGSLPGTTTTMIRRHDGRNIVALLNTRHTEHEQSIASDLDRMLHAAANEVREWPQHDLSAAP